MFSKKFLAYCNRAIYEMAATRVSPWEAGFLRKKCIVAP